MLINVKNMRLLRTDTTEIKYKLIKQNIERFFRDYIYYFNIYDRDELIIDAGYLPYHYLDEAVLNRIIDLLEKELGYAIIIVKITNIHEKGYKKGDLINIRLFDIETANSKDIDDYFNLKLYQPIYSTIHDYYNIDGKNNEYSSYVTCIEKMQKLLIEQQKIVSQDIEN